jgi:hypothetical protein
VGTPESAFFGLGRPYALQGNIFYCVCVVICTFILSLFTYTRVQLDAVWSEHIHGLSGEQCTGVLTVAQTHPFLGMLYLNRHGLVFDGHWLLMIRTHRLYRRDRERTSFCQESCSGIMTGTPSWPVYIFRLPGPTKNTLFSTDCKAEAVTRIEALVPLCADSITSQVGQACSRNLEPAHTIPRLYRRTNREVSNSPTKFNTTE